MKGTSPSILYKVVDSKLAWSTFQGAVYNRLVWPALGGLTERMIACMVPPEGGRIVDLGSGPGIATCLAARTFPSCSVVGVDYAPQQVRVARARLRREGLLNCSFAEGDAHDLPLPDKSVDLLYSIASIKHWLDPIKGLYEVRRVLKPGCRAHVAEADRAAIPEEVEEFSRRFTEPWWSGGPLTRWYQINLVFAASLTLEETCGYAEKAGLDVVSTRREEAAPIYFVELERPRHTPLPRPPS